MAVLNFREIPEARPSAKGKGANRDDGLAQLPDEFELFARDFFNGVLGFTIESGPDRGSDGGRDIIAIENRRGTTGTTSFRWLISCKHKAHSGSSVGTGSGDEQDIVTRCRKFKARGFIGFYSTLPSTALSRTAEELVSSGDLDEKQFFDAMRIEQLLLGSDNGRRIARRYFPVSYRAWEDNQPRIFLGEYAPLECECCGKDLLKDGDGLFSYFHSDLQGGKRVDNIAWTCKMECDSETLRRKAKHGLYHCGTWYDLSDLLLPNRYYEFVSDLLREVCSGERSFSREATEKLLYLFRAASQMTVRHIGFEYHPQIMFFDDAPNPQDGIVSDTEVDPE